MLTVKLILERLDKEGRLLERREQRSKSFVKNFISLLYVAHANISEASPYSITDIDGNARDIDSTSHSSGYLYAKANLMIGAPPGQAGMYCLPGSKESSPMVVRPTQVTIKGEFIGIQVGTGDVAVTPTDYQLVTRILHGEVADKLEYGGCELLGLTFSDPNGEFTIRRYFTNHSGGSITVNEVGIHSVGCQQGEAITGYAWPFLIARDVVSPGVAVADTEILRVTYVPQITV